MGITFSDSTHLNFNNEQVKQQLHVMQCRSPTFNDPAQCLLIPLQSPVGNGGVGAEAGAGAGAGDPGILQWKTGTFQVARHKEQLKGVCIFINAIA